MANDFELKVINKPIYYIEMVALLHKLVCTVDFGSIQVTADQKAFLDLLKGFRLRGLELFELFLQNEGMDDINKLEGFLADIEQTEFLYLLFGEELSREEIESIVDRFDAIDKITSVNKFLSNYEIDSLQDVFQRTNGFIDKLIEIFRILDAVVVEPLTKHALYAESIAKVSSELKCKIPLDVAQSIMGKKFKRVFDFNTYYFVPSYFYINRPMRTFNERIQVVIYPVHEMSKYDKSTLVKALKVLADDTRLEMIEKLAAKPMYGKELAKELGLVTSTVSHHLEQLRSVGLIHEEREKSVKYFSININEYYKLCDAMKSFASQYKTR